MAKAHASDRLGAEAWLHAGLDILAREGFSALTIDRLCGAVGRSKGSFYHHFHGIDGFVLAVLDYWRLTQTEAIVEQVDKLKSSHSRRTELRRQAIGLDHDVERAIRVWSGSERRAQDVIKAVDERRVRYLAEIIADLGLHSAEDALVLARLEYAALVGLTQLYPDADSDWLGVIFERLSSLITPHQNN